MRRYVVLALIVLSAACSREKEVAPEPVTAAKQPAPATATVPAMRPAPPAPAPSGISSPEQCRADGSYAAALDCFRQVAGFHFTFTEGKEKVEGEMARPRIGIERVQLTGGGATWLGASRPTGLLWFRKDGAAWKRDKAPEINDRIYQRVTLAFDPQKKEPSPLLIPDAVAGPSRHYRFTDANSGATHDVWVDNQDGHIARLDITPIHGPASSLVMSSVGPLPKLAEP